LYNKPTYLRDPGNARSRYGEVRSNENSHEKTVRRNEDRYIVAHFSIVLRNTYPLRGGVSRA